MNANHLAVKLAAIVALNDDRGLVAEMSHACPYRDEPGPASGVQAEMLIEVVIVKTRNGRLQDVRGGYRAVGDAPAAVLVQQCRFRLCPPRLNWPVKDLPSQAVESV